MGGRVSRWGGVWRWIPRGFLGGWGWDEQEGCQPQGRAGGAPGWALGLIPTLEWGWGSRPAGTGPARLTT